MRRYIIASHHLLAHGLKDTLNFLTSMDGIIDISAYMDDTDLPTQIKELFDSFDPEDEVVMMTDMLGGSVNQQFCPYVNDHRHLICGINPVSYTHLAYTQMSPKWKFLGILTFLVPVLIMTYYAVIGGWVTKYAVVYLTGQTAAAAQDNYFTSFITSPVSPVLFALLFMGCLLYTSPEHPNGLEILLKYRQSSDCLPLQPSVEHCRHAKGLYTHIP